MTSDNRYASFMLRLQQTQNINRPTWIVSMQSTKTGELRWFPSLDTFVLFLQAEFGEQETLLESRNTLNEQTLSETDKE